MKNQKTIQIIQDQIKGLGVILAELREAYDRADANDPQAQISAAILIDDVEEKRRKLQRILAIVHLGGA